MKSATRTWLEEQRIAVGWKNVPKTKAPKPCPIVRGIVMGSPIEAAFYRSWLATHPSIVCQPQVRIIAARGHPRVDFLFPAQKVIIEYDGLAFHNSPLARQHDLERDSALKTAGYVVLRFKGREIHGDVRECVRWAWEAVHSVEQRT